ncbi:Hpt domain-containing protein [Oscillatoria sp. FACHB-1406]|uniref:Hpt domain-containing protein n=1 Tax=Oscillatoria sp. FACHB-1406 TaxID=2692846 RepID=UPI001687F340|nr:Hpt domain-containing protein [Oscillatoria sp. FACHB-1406]MBD2577421.1 Hpt domain-containing protein [Oscillatoria sp. FACHB-1406]
MDRASHQKILGYFIEEAKEHLETLEQGLMELNVVVRDPERLNEMFRAAHSIKGGSAMLGYNEIQKTAHRLEDCFKILKDHEVPVNSKLEHLFLDGYEALNDLLTKLESPSGLPDEEAEKISKAAEPSFAELQHYLLTLVGVEIPELEGSASLGASVASRTNESVPQASIAQQQTVRPEWEVAAQIRKILKQMLEVFKQKSNAQTRKQLQQFCASLAKLAPQEKGWQLLTKSAYQAIGNPKFTYRVLAPVILKELKLGSDCIALGKGEEIQTSASLKQMAKANVPQILISVDPKIAAKTLKQTFNSQQLSQLVQLLSV